MIPTAEEFLIENNYKDRIGNLLMYTPEASKAMIEFTQLHVEEAAKVIADKVEYEVTHDSLLNYCAVTINKESILTAYPKEIIK